MRDSVAASVSGAAVPASAAPGDATLLLTYQGPSWTEIRDRSGQIIVSRLMVPGSVEPVKGVPPFDIILGNAHVVTLVFRGKSVDLSPYTRQNVARLTLQ
jgi:cytoskeleton protein RodZ